MARDVRFDVIANDRASSVLNRVGDSAERSSGKFAAFGGAAKAGALAAAAGLAVAAGAGIKLGLETAAGMEQAQIAFTTMLGSASKADAFIKDLGQFAAQTPFEFPGLQQAASSLISAGVNADKVIPIMRTLGDVTSGMGTGSEGIQRATIALQQMNAAGRITGEDLNQLRDAGIPVYDLLAAATGKSKAEVVKLAQAGKLGQKELGAMMQALESGKGLERFSGLMEKQSQSLSGMWSTMKDTLAMGLADALQPIIPILKDVLPAASRALGAALSGVAQVLGLVAKGFERVKPFVQTLIAAFKDQSFNEFTGKMRTVNNVGATLGTMFQRLSGAVGLLIGWVKGSLIPAFQAVASTVIPSLQRSFAQIKKAFDDNSAAIGKVQGIMRALGLFITSVLLPIAGAAVKVFGTQMALAFTVAATVVNRVVLPALKAIISTFLNVVSTIINGMAKALGIFPGIGPKLKAAAAEFNQFKDRANAALDGIRRDIAVQVSANVRVRYSKSGDEVNITTRNADGGVDTKRVRAMGGPVSRGLFLVGEKGPELVEMGAGAAGTVHNAQHTKAMLSAGSAVPPVVVQVTVHGSVIRERDLARSIRQQLADLAAKNGGDPSVFGLGRA